MRRPSASSQHRLAIQSLDLSCQGENVHFAGEAAAALGGLLAKHVWGERLLDDQQALR